MIYPWHGLKFRELDGFTCRKCGNFIRCFHATGRMESHDTTFCEECLIDSVRDSDEEISIRNDQYFGDL